MDKESSEQVENSSREDRLLFDVSISDWEVIKQFWNDPTRSTLHGTPKLAVNKQLSRRWVHMWQYIVSIAAALMLFLGKIMYTSMPVSFLPFLTPHPSILELRILLSLQLDVYNHVADFP